MDKEQKIQIEREIARARDGVGESIDALDKRLRTTLDVKAQAKQHAPKIIAGGAVVGFLVGFGLPNLLKKAMKIGVPIALAGFAASKLKNRANGDGYEDQSSYNDEDRPY
jgi:hypothetical protein